MSRPSVFFDNVDELRNEYDWMYEFMSRMAERIRGDADVHNLADYVQKLEDENARLRSCLSDDAENAKAIMGENKALRELAKNMYYVIRRNNTWWDCKSKESKAFHRQLQELGIEVDE